MKLARNVLLGILLVCMLCVSVRGVTGVTAAQSMATVSPNGSCQVSLALTLHVEEQVKKMQFPIPAQASSVSVNGSRVSAPKSGDVRNINLSRYVGNMVGDFSVNIQYTLRDVIAVTENNTQQLQLPLLSGFQYTIENLSFTVTLPGAVEEKPAFISGYHQAGIEEYLSCTVEGMTVSGTSLKELKDHETLTMTLPVSEEMFPRSIVEKQSVGTAGVGMGICAVLALLYWIITLRRLPFWRQTCTQPPQGINAGTVGCVLAMQGVDLSMMVLSWAQLGYLLIQMNRGGHVMLFKRMDMDNERSEQEQRCFKKLFGSRTMVNTASRGYAVLNRELQKKPVAMQEMLHKNTGNLKVFRTLCAGIGLFGGAGIGLAMGTGALLQGFLVVLMGVLGGISGWYIQNWSTGVLLRNKKVLITALSLGAAWLLLGLVAGVFQFALWMVLGLLTEGIFLHLAGRRTELGRQTGGQLLGLRHYLSRVRRGQLDQLCQTDPDYFFRLMPYAMALGVKKKFSKGFGGQKLGPCPYISGGGDQMSAVQWAQVMQKTVASMEERSDRLLLEKLVGIVRDIIKG